MAFQTFEIEKLKTAFPYEKASLEADFEPEDLKAINDLGVLRASPHLYLGNDILKIINYLLFLRHAYSIF